MNNDEIFLTNASNVVCHAVSAQLNLFIDLSKRVSRALIATVADGKIQSGGEELPYTVVFKMINFGGAVSLPKTLRDLENIEEDSRILGTAVADGPPLPVWTLEEERLFCIRIDTSHFAVQAKAAPAGTEVVLLETACRVGKLYGIELTLTCPAGAEFPRSEGRGLSSARFADGSSQANPASGASSMGRDGGPASPHDVSRQLQLGSTSPESAAAAVVRLDDILAVDERSTEHVRILFFPDQYGGNFFTRVITVRGGIGVQLTIELLTPGDPRRAPKKEERRPSSSSFSLRGLRTGAAELPVEAPVNVAVELSEDPLCHERCLIISFNSEETHQLLDVNEILMPHGYHNEDGGAVAAGKLTYKVASCKALTHGNFTVNLLATRSKAQAPTEREVYIAVNNFFYANVLVGGHDDEEDELSDYQSHPPPLSLSLLQTLDLEEIQEHVFSIYDYFIERATLEERQTFSLLVWSCTRECICNKVFNREEPLLDQDQIFSEMLPA